MVMVTFDTDDAQGELEIDQVSTVVPTVSPVSVELGSKEFVITPEPDILIHRPVPAVAVLPASVVEPVLTQMV